MGAKKDSVQRSLRLPRELYDWIQSKADRYHGGDFTAAVVHALSRHREIAQNDDALVGEVMRVAKETLAECARTARKDLVGGQHSEKGEHGRAAK